VTSDRGLIVLIAAIIGGEAGSSCGGGSDDWPQDRHREPLPPAA
jgi:hypothetical protein